jgi:hypothetical protein
VQLIIVAGQDRVISSSLTHFIEEKSRTTTKEVPSSEGYARNVVQR